MKTKLRFWGLVSLSVFLFGCGVNEQQSSEVEVKKVDYFADNALGNSLAIVQHPAGIHQDGITYVSYQGPLEDPYVLSYKHDTAEWLGPFKAGVSDMGKDPTRKKKIDNHGKPTMLIDDLGYIHIFFGGHGGDERHGENPLGNKHYGGNKHAVSKRPFDISEWEELENISVFGTYNQAVKMDNGDIYLFYRHGAHRSDWVYQKSTDHGRTFEEPVSFLKHKRRTDLTAEDSWYAWVTRGEGNDIIVSYDYHICWDNQSARDERGHTTERHDLYYMVFNTETGEWRNVEGDSLQIPVTREMADEKALVARTGGVEFWTFNGSSHLDELGRPHIAINVGQDIGEKTGGPKQTTHYRWDGEKWLGGNLVNPQSRVDGTDTRGDFSLRSPENIQYILGYKDQAGDGVIAYFNSSDGGESFEKGKELLRKENAGWALTAIIDNAHPDAKMIAAAKLPGTNWNKVYLLGDNGPIERSEADASVITDENRARLP